MAYRIYQAEAWGNLKPIMDRFEAAFTAIHWPVGLALYHRTEQRRDIFLATPEVARLLPDLVPHPAWTDVQEPEHRVWGGLLTRNDGGPDRSFLMKAIPRVFY